MNTRHSQEVADAFATPLVSIGVPVRNGAAGIMRALSSLSQQTHRHIEIIVSDNASDDDTAAIVERAAADPRIRLIRQPKNIGMFGNFRATLDQAQGEFFMWAAHDDARDADYIERLLERLAEAPEAIVAMGRIVIEMEDGSSIVAPSPSTMGMDLRQRMQATGRLAPFTLYGLWRTRALRRIPMREAFWSADTPIILAAAAIGSFLYVPDTAFRYVHTSKHFFRQPVAALCSIPVAIVNSYRAAAVAGRFAGMLGAWHMTAVLWRQARTFIAGRIS